MVTIIEKLSVRLLQRQKKQAASWSGFVADVVDERLKDPDEILAGLEVLNRTPEDLQAACELLIQRRAWSAVVVAGDAAERDYPGLQDQFAAAAKELEKLTERHHAKYAPVKGRIHAAREAISSGADAKRRLLETCSPEARQAATEGIDARIQEAGQELDGVRRRIRDCEVWVLGVESQGDKSATADVVKLSAMREKLQGLKSEMKSCQTKLQDLQDERGAASEALLKPESI